MDKYGIIGHPLGHSFSKNYFNEKFHDEGIDAEYINFDIQNIGNLPEVLATNPELKGLNVTIPYKEKVLSYLDYISVEARAIGAVNVIRVEHKGNNVLLKGYNSDVIGFTRSIEPEGTCTGNGRSIKGGKLRTQVARTGDGAREQVRTPRDNTIQGHHSRCGEGIQSDSELHAMRHVPQL